MVEQFTQDNFKKEVLESDVPVLVAFSAGWCSHCRVLAPILEAYSEEVEGVKVGKVDVDKEQGLAAEYKVMTIPTVFYIKNGEILEKKIAPHSMEELEDMVY